MSFLKSLRQKQEQLFFGWWIVLGSYVIQILNGALLFHAFSAYILPLQAEFGWSRAAVSGVFSMVRAESGILGPLQGWMVDRYGPRAMMRVGIALFAAGYLCFSRIDSLWGFYLSFALIALGSSLGGFIPIATTITNWFVRQRANIREKSDYLQEQLAALATQFDFGAVRGRGLLLVLDLRREIATEIATAALAQGLLLNAPRPDTLRFMPALNVDFAEIDGMISILKEVSSTVCRQRQ